ncbi:MAG: site-2 protease family protein [Planctomycetota bacterium]
MIPLGRIFGVQVKLHPIFLAVLALVFVSVGRSHGWSSSALMLVRMLVLFTLVLLHELGHSLMAKRLGIHVYDIILWPLGGMARVAPIEKPIRHELPIALAGPAVNLLLFLALWPFADEFPSRQALAGGSLIDFALTANLLMAVFNLAPAFPMDGGRVVRALLTARFSYVSATRIAARLGRALAVSFAALMMIMHAGHTEEIALVLLIAAFLYFAGRAEERQVLLRTALPPDAA